MYDTLVIGAGVAGLEAAHHLSAAGLRFAILEAQNDVGGRARPGKRDSTIELGAEFLHGKAALTKRRLQKYGLTAHSLKPEFHVFEKGRLYPAPDYWTTLAHAFSHLHSTPRDQPFNEAIARSAGMSEKEKNLSRAFVSGFDAAELEHASTNALKEGAGFFSDPEERAMGRPDDGYRPLIEAMAGPLRESIHLSTVVQRIAWQRGSVAVHTDGPPGAKILHARSVLITVPIGVLKAPAGALGAIAFEPAVPGLARSLQHLEMGQVVRLTLEFAAEAGSLLEGKFERGRFPFITSPELDYMTWWGNDAKECPTITAWAGGEHAWKLAGLGRSERVELALENLGRILGLKTSTLEVALKKAHHHDWAEDPFARGAYSYPGVGSAGAAEKLQRAVKKTLYFAGEATETDNGGTVEAAIASGKRQGTKLVRDLAPKSELRDPDETRRIPKFETQPFD